MNVNKWKDGEIQELKFWNEWLHSKGHIWKEDFKYRMDQKSECVGLVRKILESRKVEADFKILDVGAGPVTNLGKMFNGTKLNITAVDALAESYNSMDWQGSRPEPVTEYCETEKLSENFGECSFDIVHARNTLDHHYNAPLAFKNMIYVTKKGGVAISIHIENEASFENWDGLHQWNFFLHNGDLKIVNDREIHSLSEIIAPFGEIVQNQKNSDNFIETIIRRK